jgi:UV DNA damage endonuclease
MPIANLGYACINTELSNRNPKITTNRTMNKKTFLQKGPDYAMELALHNASNILSILSWNEKNNIKFFRLSSSIFPWFSEYDMLAHPEWPKIERVLKVAGTYANEHGHRLTMHPGPFNCLGSPSDSVIRSTIVDLEMHGLILDCMNQPKSHYSKINIHVGGNYGDRSSTLDRFKKNFQLLSDSVKKRLTVENDDKENMFNVGHLMELWMSIGTPIVFDVFHHVLGPKEDYKFAATSAYNTWPSCIRPIFHLSSSRKIHEDPSCSKTSHADYIYEQLDCLGLDIDVMIEAKQKELALFRYRDQFLYNKKIA